MSYITEPLIFVLGQIMKFCYFVVRDYGLSIIFFTFITKLILFPVNIFVQKNSINMVKLMPEENALKIKYIDDKDKFTDEQLKLYKKYHYNPMLGVIPLFIQIPLVLGLVGVIYRPLSYGINLADGPISELKTWVINLTGNSELAESSQIQLEVLSRIKDGIVPDSASLSDSVAKILDFNTKFLGIDLSCAPSLDGDKLLWLIPVIAGFSAWLLCYMQNKINVLQLTQNGPYKVATTIFMIAFSTYFACLVPAGVGLYWIFGNLFAIPFMFIINALIPPKKYIDFDYLNKVKAERAKKEKIRRDNMSRERADYKRFNKFEDKKLVIYCEAGGFIKYLEGTVKYINENSDMVIHYVTSDPNDKVFKRDDLKMEKYYVASDKYLIPLFLKLDCEICMMTTPDLDKYHIKRSKVRDDIEYIYACHGLGSTNLTLRKGALNNFDTILCSTPRTESEIRAIEKLYDLPKKVIVQNGYPLLDDMIEAYENSEHKKNEKTTVMIAPSWQPDNIIELCGEKLLDNLKDSPYHIILRPHPQQVRHEPERFVELKEKYEVEGGNIEITTDFSATNPVMESDILITDWSDIAFEFAYTTKRPVLFINTPMKIMNPDYDKIDIVPINITCRETMGKSIDVDKLDSIKDDIEFLLNNKDTYKDNIINMMETGLYKNLGKSKILAGKYILKRLA